MSAWDYGAGLMYGMRLATCMRSTGTEFPDQTSVGKAGKQKKKRLVPPEFHKN